MPSARDQETREPDHLPLTEHAETLLKSRIPSYFSNSVGKCVDTEVLLWHVHNG